MIWLLPGIPLLTGFVALLRVPNAWRRCCSASPRVPPRSRVGPGDARALRVLRLDGLDSAGSLFLAISSLLFLVATIHLLSRRPLPRPEDAPQPIVGSSPTAGRPWRMPLFLSGDHDALAR